MPDNQFSVRVPSILEALSGAEQGYKDVSGYMKERQVGAAREEAAKSLMQGGDTRSAIARLMSVGDIQGAHTIAGLSQNNRDFEFRQQEADRAQRNADRSFGLQQQTANTAQIITPKDANGNETPIRVDRNGNVTEIKVPGASAPSNPFSYGKLNETQSKDAGYANRMFQSEGILRDPKLIDASQSMIDRAADRILPGDVANRFVTSESYQKYDQAARDFINATLRRESGAAISQSEFDNAYKQYLPRPGDSKDVLAQKQRNRQATIASIAGGGGNNYKPPFSFDQAGNMVPTGNAQQGVTGGPVPAAQPRPAPQSAPVQISSAQQRDALPPGTQYIAPDGTVRTKQ